MKKPRKSVKKKKQEKSNPRILILLFVVPLLLILSFVFFFETNKALKVNKIQVEPYGGDQFNESTISAQIPEQLIQEAEGNFPTITLIPTQTPILTKIPTFTPVLPACSLCQYEADLYWGPVIKSFVGGKSYTSPTNRLIASASAALSGKKWLPYCTLLPVGIVPLANQENLSSECDDPIGKKYLVGSIDTSKAVSPYGYLKGTVTNTSKNCTYEVGLAIYKLAKIEDNSSGEGGKHNLYDYQMLVIKPEETAEIFIKTPMQNDGPNCHKIPEPTVSAVSTPTLSPSPMVKGYNVTVKSETVRNIFGEDHRVKFSWEKFTDISDNISNIYIRRWDGEPPSIGREYKEYKLKTDSLSFINNKLEDDTNYYYKYCLELKNFGKLFCTNTLEIKGGEPQELQAKVTLPQNLNSQVLGVSKVDEEEIFEERPDLLRIIIRWLFRNH